MKFTLSGASGVAILAGLAGALPAWGQQVDTQTVAVSQISGPQQAAPASGPQQTAPAPAAQAPDKVVVTGSFIKGSAEDAALPVEVYSQEEQEKQGSPTGLDFVKSLSISGPTTGEAYYFGGAANTGSPRINLRGIGADRTLTLLNGRRMSSNIANMPSIAIARTEILKDGAAVTYGADATGGVVNYITRDDYRGFTASGNYKAIDGSGGDYDLHAMAGFGSSDTNLLIAAEWEHRSRLETEDRDFSNLPYNVNPAPWSATTNLASYIAKGALPGTPTVANEFGSSITQTRADGALQSGGFEDFTQASCNSVGGAYQPQSFTTNTTTGVVTRNNPNCLYNYDSYYNLVEKQDIYRVFAQLNSRVNEHMDFHGEVAFGEVQAPQVFGSPSQPGNVRGPALAQGGGSQYYVPAANNASYAANPFVAQYIADYNAYAPTIGAAPIPTTVQGFNMGSFRPFAHNGNVALGEGNGFGTPSKIDNQIWRVSAGLKGDLGDWAGAFKEVSYDFATTYNSANLYNDTPDVLGYRLQQALAGFGGPSCNAPDLDPVRLGTQNPNAAGKNGCLWFNPFSTSFQSQPELNLANSRSATARGLTAPAGTAGWENSPELVRWLFGDSRQVETVNSDLTVDFVLSSETPLKLWGGNVGVAVGTQWRQVETRQTVPNDFNNGKTPCEWPNEYGEIPRNPAAANFNGCTPDNPGPYIFFSPTVPTYADRQSSSFFAEASLPITDDLNVQAAVRREDFSGDLGATIYEYTGKYTILGGPLSIRGSYGTNYSAPPITLVPGRVTNGVASIAKAGSAWLGTRTVTRSDVVPETAKSWDAGLIWQSRGFTEDSNLRILLDYFDIQTEDQIGQLATTTTIMNYAFGASSGNTGAATLATGQQLAGSLGKGCADPIVKNNLIFSDTPTSPGGACTLQTKASDVNVVALQFGNGPGQHTAGLDLTVDYTFQVGAAELALGTTVTNVEIFEFTPTVLDGIALDKGDQRLGQLNFSTIAGAVPRWRGNVFGNVNIGDQNLRATVNYVSKVRDERGDQALVTGGTTSYGTAGENYVTVDLVYQLKLPADFTVTAAISNLFDKDPPKAREELGYDPLLGDPLGRVFQIGVKKTF